MEADQDREKFEAVYREHFSAVAGYALRRADRDTALEAVAETFTVAWRRRREMPEAPRGWLLGVTRRTLADQYRSHRRTDALHAAAAQAAALDPRAGKDPADAISNRAGIRQAFTSLSRTDREILTLIAWEDLTIAEAAVAYGCSRATFGVRLHRARQRLRAALSAEQDETKLEPSLRSATTLLRNASDPSSNTPKISLETT